MEDTPPDSGTAARGGRASRRFGGLPEALLRYLEARGVLLTVETQEAAQNLLRAVFRGTLAALFGFTGWVLLMFALANLLNESLGWSWVHVGVAVGLGNLVIAAAFAFAASRRLSSARWFEHTLKEFGKDRAWLGKLNDRH